MLKWYILKTMDLITIKNCRVEDLKSVKVENVNWTFKTGEAWLVIGPNGSGKAEFLKALCSQLKIIPDSAYKIGRAHV